MNAIDKRPGERLFHDLLPYVSFEEETGLLWLKDGSATKTISITPRNCMSYTDDEFEVLRAGLASALTQLPEGALVQIILSREQTNSATDHAFINWKNTHAGMDTNGTATANQKLLDAQKSELEKLYDDSFFHQTKIYLTLRLPCVEKVRIGKQLGVFAHIASSKNRAAKLKSAQLIREETSQVFDSLKSSLEGIGFETQDLKKDELMKIVFQFINPDRKAMPPSLQTGNQTLAESFSLSELIETRQGLHLGRSKIKIGTLKTLPESSFPCLMNSLAVLGKPFCLVVTFLMLPQTEERERLSRKQRLAQGMASGNQVRNFYAESQLQDVEDTLSAMISSGDKLLAASFHVFSFEEVSNE